MNTNLATEYWAQADEIPPVEPTSQTCQTNPPPVARPLSALEHHPESDPNELLRHRYLCKGGGLLIPGPSGIGKSVLAMQFAITWALSRACIGIAPARALKSLFIQAEDDDGDLAEMRDGIYGGLQLAEDEQAEASSKVVISREDERTGIAFWAEVVRPLLDKHRPDLLWLNPVLAYLGGDASSQKDVGGFLRNGLNPLLREYGCGCGLIHHTNKPLSGKEKQNWRAGDFAYLGSGSAEWANWPRAVLALRSIGERDVFELHAAKRGNRLGWREADGQTKAFVKYLAHAKEPGAIFWREVASDEFEQGGRPKQFDADEVLALLPPEGLKAGEWKTAAFDDCGIKEGTFHNLRRTLAKAKRITKSKVSGKWQPILKP